jgi:DNA repair protein RadC
MSALDQEQMWVVVLSTRNDVLSIEMVYQGNLNTTWVRLAELFKEAIRRNGAVSSRDNGEFS